MRFLTIVRHCEAEPGSADYDRVLTAAGRAQGRHLREQVETGDLSAFGPATALVSSASRTRETYALAFAGTPFVRALETSDLIYNGKRDVSATDLLSALAEIDPVTENLLVVAHNPSVYELAATLADELPEALIRSGFAVGSAVVMEIRDDQPISLEKGRVIAVVEAPLT
jgi:phosphohistidine phosphatase SixA